MPHDAYYRFVGEWFAIDAGIEVEILQVRQLWQPLKIMLRLEAARRMRQHQLPELPLTVRYLSPILLLTLTVGNASADEHASTTWMQVLPRLKERCVKCHGPIKPKAGLNLSSAASLALGGENGPAIVAGNLDESLIWQRISAGEMPPDEPLSAADQTILRRWIEAGADGLPRPDDPATKRDALHWAFRSLVRPTVPKLIRQNTIVRTAIDRFVQQRLESAGLSISSEVERATLIRRVCFDLTGLPPTPEAILEFQADRAPDAYQKIGGPLSGFATLRRPLGQILAGCGWLCGLQRVLRRGHRSAAGLSLPRLGHPRI